MCVCVHQGERLMAVTGACEEKHRTPYGIDAIH
jgi:hypothetical protein